MAICEFDFYSRTPTDEGRIAYIVDNLEKYFCPDELKDYKRFEAFIHYPSSKPIDGNEGTGIAKCIHSLIARSRPKGEDTFLYRCHPGEVASDSFDIHVLLVASR